MQLPECEYTFIYTKYRLCIVKPKAGAIDTELNIQISEISSLKQYFWFSCKEEEDIISLVEYLETAGSSHLDQLEHCNPRS